MFTPALFLQLFTDMINRLIIKRIMTLFINIIISVRSFQLKFSNSYIFFSAIRPYNKICCIYRVNTKIIDFPFFLEVGNEKYI